MAGGNSRLSVSVAAIYHMLNLVVKVQEWRNDLYRGGGPVLHSGRRVRPHCA